MSSSKCAIILLIFTKKCFSKLSNFNQRVTKKDTQKNSKLVSSMIAHFEELIRLYKKINIFQIFWSIGGLKAQKLVKS